MSHKHSNDQTLQLIKQSGAFILGSVLTCCPSISIDLSFDRQHHKCHTPVHRLLRWVLCTSFVYKCMRRVVFEGSRHSVVVRADAKRESVMFLKLGNPVQSLSEYVISVFDQSMLCMTLPHSLWSGRFRFRFRFCPMLKVCTVHKLLTKSHGK